MVQAVVGSGGVVVDVMVCCRRRNGGGSGGGGGGGVVVVTCNGLVQARCAELKRGLRPPKTSRGLRGRGGRLGLCFAGL